MERNEDKKERSDRLARFINKPDNYKEKSEVKKIEIIKNNSKEREPLVN